MLTMYGHTEVKFRVELKVFYDTYRERNNFLHKECAFLVPFNVFIPKLQRS